MSLAWLTLWPSKRYIVYSSETAVNIRHTSCRNILENIIVGLLPIVTVMRNSNVIQYLLVARYHLIVYFEIMLWRKEYIPLYGNMTIERFFSIFTGYSIMKESLCRHSARHLLPKHNTVNLFLCLGCHLFIRWACLPVSSHTHNTVSPQLREPS
jgi:hypothetical protein